MFPPQGDFPTRRTQHYYYYYYYLFLFLFSPGGFPDATGREVTAEEGAPADAGSPTDQADGGFEDKRMEATAPDLSSDFEEILIVGEAKEAIAQKETTSVVSFDVDTLRMENIQNIADLSNLTPNLEIKTAFAASNPTLFIRGIGLDDYNANSSSAVAVT